MADEDQKIDVAAAPKPKRKRLTVEERMEKLQANIQAKAERAAQRARNTAARRAAKVNEKKTIKAKERGELADVLRRQINQMAANAQLSLTAANVKIPSKGAKADHLQKYFNAAKARYYKRTKKASSFQRHVLSAARNQGINQKYIKFGRNKTINAILKKATERKAKNTAKASKSEKRVAILEMAAQQMGLNEKDLMSIVCVRKKVEKK